MKIVLKWLAAACFTFAAIAELFFGPFFSFLFLGIGAAICAPATFPWLERKTKFRFKTGHKYGAVALCFFVGVILAGKDQKTDGMPTSATKLADAPAGNSADTAATLSVVDILHRELEFFNRPFDGSAYRGSIEAAQGELLLFHFWKIRIVNGEASQDREANRLASQLKQKVVKMQIGEFPKLRKAYAQALHNKTWEHDVTVSVAGKDNSILQLTGYHFSLNKNIKDMQDILGVTPHEFRFKQVQYRWYNGADEYQYFTLETPADNELVELYR